MYMNSVFDKSGFFFFAGMHATKSTSKKAAKNGAVWLYFFTHDIFTRLHVYFNLRITEYKINSDLFARPSDWIRAKEK